MKKPEHFTIADRLPISRKDRLKYPVRTINASAEIDSGKVLREKRGEVRREVDNWLEMRGK